MPHLKQTVLITGGSRGIGYATAELFSANQWNVVLCSRDAAKTAEAARTITKITANENVLGIGADIGDAQAIDRLFAAADQKFPSLDALVNNAAVLHKGSLSDFSDTQYAETMRVNVEGMMRCCRHAFARMRGRGGSIVNVSSLAGISGTDKNPGLWAYTARKFAGIGLTDGLAVEGRPNIRVNCVAPGATDTEMLRKAAPHFKAKAVPADIARIIYCLCDNEQSGILSGATIPVYSNG